MAEVARVNTPFTESEAARFLIKALTEEMGKSPYREQLALLLGQLMLESANGRSCYGNNPGNLTANDKGTSDYYRPPWFAEPEGGFTNPRYRALHDAMRQGKAPRAFLAFDSIEKGIQVYANWLNRKFPSILKAAETGDAVATAEAIRSSGYCPDCEPKATATTLQSFKTKFATLPELQKLPLARAATPGERGSLSSVLPASLRGEPRDYLAAADLPRLTVGSEGTAVRLFFRLVFGLDADLYTRNLESIVKRYQLKHGLKIDGIVGPITWFTVMVEFAKLPGDTSV